jgi:predicted site-specific integrase-resolvase
MSIKVIMNRDIQGFKFEMKFVCFRAVRCRITLVLSGNKDREDLCCDLGIHVICGSTIVSTQIQLARREAPVP